MACARHMLRYNHCNVPNHDFESGDLWVHDVLNRRMWWQLAVLALGLMFNLADTLRQEEARSTSSALGVIHSSAQGPLGRSNTFDSQIIDSTSSGPTLMDSTLLANDDSMSVVGDDFPLA